MASELVSQVTNGIRVSIRSAYIPDESSPRHQYFVFAYQIQIQNESTETIQLLSREWHITSGYSKKRVVSGAGVIGQQPIIKPGAKFEYVSGVDFQCPIGKMEGHYLMTYPHTQETFKVQIPPFMMVYPILYN